MAAALFYAGNDDSLGSCPSHLKEVRVVYPFWFAFLSSDVSIGSLGDLARSMFCDRNSSFTFAL